jgi:hypothetical protein
MESGGAVFFPAAGLRNGSSVEGASMYGYVWSSTHSTSSLAHFFYCATDVLFPQSVIIRYNGFSVRLVSDVK